MNFLAKYRPMIRPLINFFLFIYMTVYSCKFGELDLYEDAQLGT
jgi:hypothetical protein